MANWNASPFGSFSTTEGSAAAAVREPKIWARFRSCNPPAMISAVEAEVPSTRIANGPAYDSARALITNFSAVSRSTSVPRKAFFWSTNQLAMPVAMAPKPPGLPRRSITKPSHFKHDSTAVANSGIRCAGSKKRLKPMY